VVVLHMNASVPSMLPNILQRQTRLRVAPAQDGVELESGTVYPAVADHHLLIDDGIMRLGRGPRENNFRPAVDPLFRTAAAAYRDRVIGIVVSGNLDDGTAGLVAIKRYGGVAIVQDPEEAPYPGMPSNALDVIGDVDHVLPAERIAAFLTELVGVTRQPGAHSASGKRIPNDIAIGGDEAVAEPEGSPSNARESNFGCPACGGVLKEMQDGELVHYRCRVGHAFSEEALLSAQTENLETALWTALRALEEAAEQARTLADRMLQRGHSRLAQRFTRRAGEALRRAAIVRSALTYSPESVVEAD
jgi:two-component system chemotaxis response regulator CheB